MSTFSDHLLKQKINYQTLEQMKIELEGMIELELLRSKVMILVACMMDHVANLKECGFFLITRINRIGSDHE